jgi:hypothetical protein
MIRPLEAFVLCEGYDDRSFWQGWLEDRLGFTPRKLASERGRHGALRDCYTYQTKAGGLIHVIACRGGLEVWAIAREKLRDRTAKPISRLVINVDVDDGTIGDLRASIQSLLDSLAPHASGEDWTLEDGTLVSLVPWHVPVSGSYDLPGVPAKQTLERIVCTAICRAKPEWGEDVKAWLASRRDPRGAEHKAHGWSYVAGWFADHGPGDYYAAVWRDPAIAAELEGLMEVLGARRIVDALAGLGTAEE